MSAKSPAKYQAAPPRGEARSVTAQPKRLALLIYLALAEPPGPKRRDALLALLWPESEQDKGRQVLRQTVYLLRQSLGAAAIVSVNDEDLALDPGIVSCDARRFESLLAKGDLRAALEVYRGDFLDGFFVPGVSQEFEEWVAATRHRLRGRASTAAWTMAANDERNGHASSAMYSTIATSSPMLSLPSRASRAPMTTASKMPRLPRLSTRRNIVLRTKVSLRLAR